MKVWRECLGLSRYNRYLQRFCPTSVLIGVGFAFPFQGGYYLDETETRLPDNRQISVQATMGDVDLDGDLDIMVANVYTLSTSGQNRLLMNDGSGNFRDETDSRMPLFQDDTRDIVLLDVDGDGDLDCMTANAFNNAAPDWVNRLYLNDGTGHFEDASSGRIPQNRDPTSRIEFTDVDGDSDLDLFWVNYPANRLLLNDGKGFFTDASSTQLDPDTVRGNDAAFGDVDNDGDADLLIAGFDLLDSKPNYLYINDGSGHFTEQGGSRLPDINDGSLSTKGGAFGDIDRDGDLDILFNNGSTLVLMINDGSGYYIEGSSRRLPTQEIKGSTDAQFVDADLDGDLDIFVSVHGGGGEQNLLYINIGTGSGSFTDETMSWLPQQRESSWGIALGDVDGDTDVDIFLACSGNLRNHLLINYLRSLAIGADTIQSPGKFVLFPNYPNPFNSRTTIAYKVSNHDSRIRLSINNVLGQHVVTLVDRRQEPGLYQVTWDSRNKFGEKVTAGVYIYTIEAEASRYVRKFLEQRKFVLLK